MPREPQKPGRRELPKPSPLLNSAWSCQGRGALSSLVGSTPHSGATVAEARRAPPTDPGATLSAPKMLPEASLEPTFWGWGN